MSFVPQQSASSPGIFRTVCGYASRLSKTCIPALTALLLVPGSPASAKNAHTYFRTYTINEGLNSNSIYGIVQDSAGFIWLGTNNGLCRFDGKQFRQFRKNDGCAISNNNILHLAVDRNGRIWLSLDNGVDIYDPSTDEFSHFDAATDDGTQIRNRAIKIMEDSDGEIWISTVKEGLFRYNPETDHLTVYRHNPDDDTSIAQDYISTIYESGDGTIWLGTYDKGLCAFSKTDGTFARFRAEGGGFSRLSDNSVNAIVEDSFGNLWIGTVNHGIDCLDRRTGAVTNFDDRKSNNRLHHIHHLAEYAPGELFVCSHTGASVFGTAGGKLVPKDDDITFSNSHNRYINTSFRDREGNLWLGSLYNGAEFHPARNNFKYYSTSSSDNPDFGSEVLSICHYRGTQFWIGSSNNGIMLFDSCTGEIEPFSTAHDMRTPSFQANSMLSDNGRLWIAAYQHGVMAIDTATGRKTSYLSDPLSPRVFTLYRNTFGVIYAGTATGLYRYDSKSDLFELVHESSRICCIAEDHNGLLWVATSEQGIYTYDAKLNRTVSYRSDDDPASPCSNSVTTFAVDNAKRIWVGTDDGICRYDFERDRFVRYPELNLPDNNIKKIIPHGNLLWITTGNGLSSFDPETGTLKNYRHSDGLCSPLFMPNAGICTSSGHILLGTADGICMFTPRNMFSGMELPPVAITDLLINGVKMHPSTDASPLSKPIEKTSAISLSHKQRLVGLRFTAPSYLAPQSIRYRFRLDGAQKNETWHTLDDEHSTVYYNLDPGHYTFRVQAATDNRTWGGETTLAIRIRPPFLLSTAAWAIYFTIACLAIFLSTRQMQRRNRRKYAESIRLMESSREHEHYRAQVNLLTTLSHEIRTPLSLIIGPLEYIMKNHAAADKFGEYLRIIKNSTDRLQELIDQLLDFRQARDMNDKAAVRFAECDITGLLDTQAELFRFPASKKGIDIRVERPDGLTIVSDRETLTKVLGNLLSNAVKFARHGILLTARRQERGIVMEVSDDGSGIPEALRHKVFELFYQIEPQTDAGQKGLGVGLHLVHTLVHLLGGDVRIADGPHAEHERKRFTGATFSVFIPDPDPNMPVPARTAAIADRTPEPAAQEKLPEKPVVMVVEDNSNMLSFLTEILSGEYTVISAGSGEEALESLPGNEPDMIVSDIMMPGISGIELCRRLKNDIRTSHIPVVLLSAKTDTGTKVESLCCGAEAYLEKPFSPEHLRAQLENLICRRKTVCDKFGQTPISQIRIMTQSRLDAEFIESCRKVVVDNMNNVQLSVDFLAQEVALSRTAIFKKLRALTGMTPNDFMKAVRLDEASRMIVEGKYSITEIGFITGFSSSSYFAKCFVKQFGVLPSEYVQEMENRQK